MGGGGEEETGDGAQSWASKYPGLLTPLCHKTLGQSSLGLSFKDTRLSFTMSEMEEALLSYQSMIT